MKIIYLHDLRFKKVAVCRALFEAAAKTEKGIEAKKYGIQITENLAGLYGPLQDYDIEEDLRSADQTQGHLSDIGYLKVNLTFEFSSLDVTQYEEIYGLSAKTVLEVAGFTCSYEPISNLSTSTTPATSSAYDRFFGNKKNIQYDRRFKKLDQDGVLYKGESTVLCISDDELRAYGAKQWKRTENGIDHLVLITEMEESVPEMGI